MGGVQLRWWSWTKKVTVSLGLKTYEVVNGDAERGPEGRGGACNVTPSLVDGAQH